MTFVSYVHHFRFTRSTPPKQTMEPSLNADIQNLLEYDVTNNLTEASAQRLTLKRKRLRGIIYAWIRKAKINRQLPSMEELYSVSDKLFDVDRLLVEVDSVEELNKCSEWDKKIQFLRDAIERGGVPQEAVTVAVPTVATVQVPAAEDPFQTVELLPMEVVSQAAAAASSAVPESKPNLNDVIQKESTVISPSWNLETQKKLWVSYKANQVFECSLCKVEFGDPRRHLQSKRHFKNLRARETGVPKVAQKFLDRYPFLKLQGDKFFCPKCGTFLTSSSNFSAKRHLNSDAHKNGEKAKEAHLQWLEEVSRDEVTTEFREVFAARGIPQAVFKNQAFMDFLTKVTGRVLFTETAMRLKDARTGDSEKAPASTAPKKRSQSKSGAKTTNGKGGKRGKTKQKAGHQEAASAVQPVHLPEVNLQPVPMMMMMMKGEEC